MAESDNGKTPTPEKPVRVSLVAAQQAAKIREEDGVLVDFEDLDRWGDCMPRMVGHSSPGVQVVAKPAKAAALDRHNKAKPEGDRKLTDYKRLDTDEQRGYQLPMVVASLRGEGIGIHAYWDGEQAVELDLSEADTDSTREHFSAALEASGRVPWFLGDLYRAGLILAGPELVDDDPDVPDAELLELEKKGSACSLASRLGMLATATTSGFGRSATLTELLKTFTSAAATTTKSATPTASSPVTHSGAGGTPAVAVD